MVMLVEVTGVGSFRVDEGTAPQDIRAMARELQAEQAALERLQSGEELLPGAEEALAAAQVEEVPVEEEVVEVEDTSTTQEEARKGEVDLLLELIRETETDLGYNQIVGHNKTLPLDSMSLDSVMDYQRTEMKPSKGFESTAVGGYQFINSTLKYLKRRMKLTGDETMTPELQDRMAVELLKRRGLDKWLAGSISDEKFGTNISKEWASFPVIEEISGKKAGQSYYNSVGTNKALVGVEEVLRALENSREPEEEEFEVPSPELADVLVQQEQEFEQQQQPPFPEPQPLLDVAQQEAGQSPAPEENVEPAAPQAPTQGTLNQIPGDITERSFPKQDNPTIVGQSKDPIPTLFDRVRSTLFE